MMASPETKPNVCLMCLDAPAVGKLGTCDHSYCKSCLHAHIEDQLKGQHEVIACPACQGQSQPDDPKVNKGEAFVDSTVEYKDEEALSTGDGYQAARTGGEKKAALLQANCKLCHYKAKTVKAVNTCKECNLLSLCTNCSQVHGENTVTHHHIMTPLNRMDGILCKDHDEVLKFFCNTCSLNVCSVCISLDHMDHAVETFNDVVNTEVEKVRSALNEEEKWLYTLKSDEKELQKSKASAQEIKDVLSKSIEDHAEKCIEEIIKNKVALKKQVRDEFEIEIKKIMEKRLEAMPELQRTSADIVAEANQLLNEAELHSTYVEKLIGLKQQLDKLEEGHYAYFEKSEKYKCSMILSILRAMKFYPRIPNCKIGGFQKGEPRCDEGGPCVCETCGQQADETRVDECRKNGRCFCGTCGCGFIRKKLDGYGYCDCGCRITTYNNQQFP